MTVSPRWATAAASLIGLTSITFTSAERILIIPTSSQMMTTSPFNSAVQHVGLGGEPPCRQRRLEPFRRNVREVCFPEAVANCGPRRDIGERDLVMSSPLDELFNELFVTPRRRPSGLFFQEADEVEEDPFDQIFNSMLGFSLRAFDMFDAPQMVMGETQPAQASQGATPASPSSSSGVSDAASDTAEDNAATTPPLTATQAAENSLDGMVASLARRAAASDMDASVVTNLPHRLLQFGNDLLAETHRRRLTEGEEGGADPHLEVKEHLARRLTEYTETFYFPGGSSSIVYTSNSLPSFMTPPSHSSSSSSTWGGLPSYRPPLGMGSENVDECIRSRYRDGGLSRGCHDAVHTLLLAVDNRDVTVPNPPPESKGSIREMKVIEFPKSEERSQEQLRAWITFAVATVLVSALLMVLCTGDEEYEDEDDGVSNEGGEGTEFDYLILPGDDNVNSITLIHGSPPCQGFSGANTSDDEERPVRRAGEPKVFVGVPVQVV